MKKIILGHRSIRGIGGRWVLSLKKDMLIDFVVNISGLLWDSETETSLTEVKFFEQVCVYFFIFYLFISTTKHFSYNVLNCPH